MSEQPASSAPRGFATRTPPTFETTADERRHRIERLAAACRVLGAAGCAEGLLGHITVRDPENPAHF